MNCVSIGSGNGLSLVWCQAITWTNAHLLTIEPVGTKFGEIQNKIRNFSFNKMHLKMSADWLTYRNTQMNNQRAVDILLEHRDLLVSLHGEYNDCWCPGDVRSQGISSHVIDLVILTRATRTAAFWGYPPPPHDYPHCWVILDPKSK